MGIRSKNLVTLLILICYFGLQTVFALPDEEFIALPEERLPAFPDEQLFAFPDSKLLINSDEQCMRARTANRSSALTLWIY